MRSTAIYTVEPPGAEKRFAISPMWFALIVIGVSTYFIYGQLIFPIWVLPAIPIVLSLGLYLINRENVLLPIFILTVTLIQLKSEHGGFSIYDALAGAVIVGIFFSLLAKKIATQGATSLGSTEYIFFILYILWVGILGMLHVFLGLAPIESWFRDLLLLSPLLVIPPIFRFIDLQKRSDKLLFYGTMLLLWVICMIVSAVNVRSSYLSAEFLFQVTYRGVNLISAPFMILVFFHLYLAERKGSRRKLYVLGLLISIGSLVLIRNRTMWGMISIGICATPFFLKKDQRTKAFKLLGLLFVIIASFCGVMYVLFPFFRVLLGFVLGHFLTTTNLTTDYSLIGRYIEWRFVWKTIMLSPITGYGLGGMYRNYNWFAGYFFDTAYTHNGFFGVLLQGGAIGFILLYGSYLAFIKKGMTLLQTKLLSDLERAFVRVGISLLIFLIVATWTFNMFGHRDVLLYVGIVWGYFLYISRTAPSLGGSIPAASVHSEE
ncbi:MAG: O-antigen ligase family protein [Bacteroidota bacterium]|nr:O-antigen ligase family protein [Bacteroidota bacterium]MDP4228914.1 O-antigen ligase family protein [Bacteroidota bacterium]MDP4236098.1 O-antigen ligase family protein [Bacteroidota bacterium]